MKRPSLTLRLSLMFVCAVVAVLVVAGFTFDGFSRHHFKALDRQAMTEKLESIRQIMDGEAGSADRSDVLLQLQALLGAHQELSASIVMQGEKRSLQPLTQLSILLFLLMPLMMICGSGQTEAICTEG